MHARHLKKILATGLICMGVFALAGCGGASGEDLPTEIVMSTPEPEPTETPEEQAPTESVEEEDTYDDDEDDSPMELAHAEIPVREWTPGHRNVWNVDPEIPSGDDEQEGEGNQASESQESDAGSFVEVEDGHVSDDTDPSQELSYMATDGDDDAGSESQESEDGSNESVPAESKVAQEPLTPRPEYWDSLKQYSIAASKALFLHANASEAVQGFSPVMSYTATGAIMDSVGKNYEQAVLTSMFVDNKDMGHAYISSILEDISEQNAEYGYSVRPGVSLWLDRSTFSKASIREDALETIAGQSYADVWRAAMGDASGNDAVSGWLEDRLGKPVASSVTTSRDWTFDLISGLGISAGWDTPFSEKAVQDLYFTNAKKKSHTARFIVAKQDNATWIQTKYYKIASLPAAGVELVFIVPEGNVSTDDLLANDGFLNGILDYEFPKDLYVKGTITWNIPVGTFSGSSNTATIFSQSGLYGLLTEEAGDFSGLFSGTDGNTDLRYAVQPFSFEIGCNGINVSRNGNGTPFWQPKEQDDAADSDAEKKETPTVDEHGKLINQRKNTTTMEMNKPFILYLRTDDGLPLYLWSVHDVSYDGK